MEDFYDNNLFDAISLILCFLEQNLWRQSTISLHDLLLEDLTMNGNELRLFWVKNNDTNNVCI